MAASLSHQRKKYVTETEETDTQKKNDSPERNVPLPPKKRVFSLRLIQRQKLEDWQKFKSFIWKCLVILLALLIICMGHVYGAVAIIIISSRIYKEVIQLKRKEDLTKVEQFSWVDWYAYSVCLYALTPRFFIRRDLLFQAIQTLIDSVLVIIGLIVFLMSLKRGISKPQLRKLGWTLIVLFFVFGFSFIQIYNLYKGVYWVIFPLICVPFNTFASSIVGVPFGKTPLNKNLPTKTIEGYVGGLLLTALWAYFASGYLLEFQYLICPQTELTFAIFQGVKCETPEIFIPKDIILPEYLQILGNASIFTTKAQLHSVIISIFASLVAPFGLFVINGFKKAFRIKDHENISDSVGLDGVLNDVFRVQGVLAAFVFIYLNQMVFRSSITLEKVIDYIEHLTIEDKQKLIALVQQSMVNSSTSIQLL